MATTSKRTRLILVAVAWLVGIPGSIWLWNWFGWFSLVLIAGIVWVTVDYYRKGDFLGPIERTQREGTFLPDAFRDEKPRD